MLNGGQQELNKSVILLNHTNKQINFLDGLYIILRMTMLGIGIYQLNNLILNC
jgi:hypothetical protein